MVKMRKMKTKMIDLQTMRESPRLKESAVTLNIKLIKSIVMSFVTFVIQVKCYVVIVLDVLILTMQILNNRALSVVGSVLLKKDFILIVVCFPVNTWQTYLITSRMRIGMKNS